jgi:hypothetical protein
MQTETVQLKITPLKAMALYSTATEEFKVMLEDSFGKEFFSKKITDRVKTFEDAMNILGDKVSSNVATLLAYNGIDNAMLTAKAAAQLSIIAEALNDGWKPDWKNTSEWKYYPWFDLSSGSGLSCSGYDDYFSNSTVGSRLCFKSRELAEYAGKQFIKLYEAYFVMS